MHHRPRRAPALPGCAADAPTKSEEQPRPAEQCRAEHGDDPVRRCIRPARHTENHAAGDGWHCLEDIAIYPATEELEGCRCHHGDEHCSGCRRCPDVCNGCDGPGHGDAR
ncbi:hypothetical protein GCM10010271_64840 [Streptomyces kurssanovii]|nr:hypothetical protein GCM10010271_64840 [Streptomyces kurssanovii]